ncbi:hypothetical protein IFM89_025150 [Coptis chinensis]|uniref:Uncharacterized protein n=1 Tax=Coptis chinensis TaxID=261450 RepID=A0A835HXE0_9MAGN|nr:hypothetical protein IFM89_025150 [Coptis chinensis]
MNAASKPDDQLPESNNGKEAAESDQPAWKRKKNKRNRRKKNTTTQAPNAGDSISELEEITQNTAEMEVKDTVDAVSNRNSGTLGSVENARKSIVAVTNGDQAIVSERADDQVGGNLQEGEHTGCGIRSYDDAHSLQLVVAAVTDPIASLKSAYVQRRALWDELSQLGLNVEAWAVAGDFNVVTSNKERKGGRLPCQIAKWIDAATGWRSKILQRRISDHSPIVGWFTAIPKPHNIPFKFKKHWIKHESLKEVVKQSWEERLEDAPIKKVMKKLKRLKEVLKTWSWETFGDLSKKKKRVTEDLERIMKEQEENPFNVQL